MSKRREPSPFIADARQKARYAWRVCLKCAQNGRPVDKKRKDGGALFWSYGPQNRLCDHHSKRASSSGLPEDKTFPVAVDGGPGNTQKAVDPDNPFGLTWRERRVLGWRKR